MSDTSSGEKFSIDANVLVYSVDAANLARQERALAIVDRAVRCSCTLSTQALAEFFRAVTRKGIAPKRAAAAQVRDWARTFPVVGPSLAELLDALGYAEQGRLSVWDALLLATVRQAGCTLLLSEDMQDGMRFGGLTVVNPFKGASLPKRAAAALGLH